jgi:hypothetical protein
MRPTHGARVSPESGRGEAAHLRLRARIPRARAVSVSRFESSCARGDGSRLALRAMITPPRRSLPRLSVTASPAEAVTGELVPVAAGAAETGQLDIELCDRLGEVENGVRSTSQR